MIANGRMSSLISSPTGFNIETFARTAALVFDLAQIERSWRGATTRGVKSYRSITATALISTMQRGSVASFTTCTVVVAGLASPKYSPQTRFNAS